MQLAAAARADAAAAGTCLVWPLPYSSLQFINSVERSLRKRASDAEAALAAAEQQVIYKKQIEVSLGPNDFYYYYYYYY